MLASSAVTSKMRQPLPWIQSPVHCKHRYRRDRTSADWGGELTGLMLTYLLKCFWTLVRCRAPVCRGSLVDLWLICGWSLVDLWLISGWSLVDLLLISGWSLADLWLISGWSLVDLWLISGWSLADLLLISGWSLADLWLISGCSLVVLAELRRRVLSLISCFSGGVFLATCLLGLLPDYLQGINEAFSNAGVTVRSHRSRLWTTRSIMIRQSHVRLS